MDILPFFVYSLESIPQIVDIVVEANKLMIFSKNGLLEKYIDLSFAYIVSAQGALFSIVAPCST